MADALKLVFVTKADPDSGNFNTAQRICQQLINARPTWQYKIISVNAADNSSTWCQIVDDLFSADVLLCLHFYRCAEIVSRVSNACGRHLPPVIGIAGGTDLNVDSRNSEKLSAMREFVRQCRFKISLKICFHKKLLSLLHVVVFSKSMQRALVESMEFNLEDISVKIIPQGILFPLLVTNLLDSRVTTYSNGDRPQKYFIILGRIRPVKNCSSVLEPFHRWSCQRKGQNEPVRLLFVGDIEDSDYGEQFKTQISRLSDVDLLSGVHHRRALELMRDSLGLINCSLSEGQSNSILEAMSLGVPVIASSIPGNIDIVEHLHTGFVFEDDKQLIKSVDTVASQDSGNRQLVQRLTESAKTYVREKHSLDSELRAYLGLIADCCSGAA